MSSLILTAITWPFFELETWDFACKFILTLQKNAKKIAIIFLNNLTKTSFAFKKK